MPYEYVLSVNRYRNTQTGRFIPRPEILEYVQALIDSNGNAGAVLAEQLTSGTISPDDYGLLLKENLKDNYVQEMILGRGGRSQVTSQDWGYVGAGLKPRYAEIDSYVLEIKAAIEAGEPFSQAYLSNRNRLYFQQSRQMYERGNSSAYGTPQLPAYPGDLSTICKSGCKCSWRIENLGNGDFNCYWELAGGENCPDCVNRAGKWSPLEIRDGVILNASLINDSHAYKKLVSYSEIAGVLNA